MRLLALLLLAAVAGFAVGRLTAPEKGGARGPGLARHPRGSWPAEPPAAKPPEPARDAPEPVGEVAGIVQPAEPSPDLENVLEVDFRGFAGDHVAWVGWRADRGGYETESFGAEDGIARSERDAGIYDVWWYGPDGRRLGTRARIEAGRVTRLKATELDSAAPVPAGLGLLLVEVGASWGGRLPEINVWITGREPLAVATNRDGFAGTPLVPGRYRVRVGDREDQVVVATGRTTVHRVEHRREGDLILDGDACEVWLEQVDADPLNAEASRWRANRIWSSVVGGVSMRGFPYLSAGEYDIRAGMDPRGPIGRVVIRPGLATRFRCELPGGGIKVKLLLAPGSGHGNGAAWLSFSPVDAGGGWGVQVAVPSESVHRLVPGRYLVTVQFRPEDADEATVEVGDRIEELTFTLSR